MALSAYCTRADWPHDWPGTDRFDNVANFGLLLRWEAALEELRAFSTVPEVEVTAFLQRFAGAIHHRLQNDPMFEALPVPALDRGALSGSTQWDRCQTIIPFLLHHTGRSSTRTPLTREQTMQVYRALQKDSGDGKRYQLGQPVACGTRKDVAVSALRLCVSARIVVQGCANQGKDAAAVLESALGALDKAAILVSALRS
jgi:hypothetical protein